MVSKSKTQPMSTGQKFNQKMADTILPMNKVLRNANSTTPPRAAFSGKNDAAIMRAEVARVQARREAARRAADPDDDMARPKVKAKAKGGMMKMGVTKKPMKKAMKKAMKKK